EAVDDAELEDLIQDVELKPVEVERVQPRRVPLPQLASLSAPRPSSKRLANVKTRFSPAAHTGGLSGNFGSFIVGLRKSGLDVAIVIDATASMQHVIDDIKTRTSALVTDIRKLVPIARVGVVAFRDKGEAFSVKWSDLSFHASKTQSFIQNLEADGGGDYEEGVRQGLEATIDDLSWRKRSKRVIILVGSSPPHKEDMPAIRALAREFHDTGGVISAIDLTRRMHEEYEYRYHLQRFGRPPEAYTPLPPFYKKVSEAFGEIANAGGGELATLGSDRELTEQILYFAFGSRWQKEVARYTSKN
ncbi:MAG: vWA domain-containing protein, partial [Gemmatimonadota bacterium]